MNEDAQKELVSWLEMARKGAESSGDFLASEAGGVAHDIVALGRSESTGWLLLYIVTALAFLAFWIGMVKVVQKAVKDGDKEHRDGAAVLYVIFGVVTFICGVVWLCTIGSTLHNFFSSWFAPRVYVLETIASWISKVRS